MKYSLEHAASAELMRLVLQKMVGHPAAFTPPTYAVWFEYSAGINPALNEAMDKLLDSNAKLDDNTIEHFYERYVSECSSDMQQILSGKIKLLLHQLASSSAETSKEAVRFDKNLQTYGNTLKGNLDSATLRSLVNEISGDTAKMRASTQDLQAQLVASQQEVEKLNHEIESARIEALTDPLTRIFNRRGFESKAKPIFADPASSNKGLCVLVLDIDHFKKINDTYGHLFGDKVICAIASALKSKVKGQDAVARMGGEEFAVLLPETNLKGAFAVAEQIRQTIEQGKIRLNNSSDTIGGISVSVGIAAHTSGSSLTELLDQADKALYSSKQGGRNKTSVFGAH